ncbi:four helix bundle protein [Coraliomargarita sinensis]|uniref:Four helix bundle protein n=1 Tax=Coraliomargarita sinensis TaxID=2174842 RepID=A0A317ZHE1_9BACT|nr:four helix bundle protein [Coraliomargarita sinensis]PXA03653.1 four helix bundle protein [Coraliomargarita sinensis]
MGQFRFEDLKIWQRACDVGDELCNVADELEKKRLYRFAEQMRGAAVSISNNIAEGSGSTSKAEFKNFLNYARRSVFECASMTAFFARKGYIDDDVRNNRLRELDEVSKMITKFSRSL